tara:strand:- start:188 stop:586 length:399 start_codon:yes stop_codon:yes gene_type:complete
MSNDQEFAGDFYATAKNLGMAPEELLKSHKIQHAVAAQCRQMAVSVRALHEALVRQDGDVMTTDAEALARLVSVDLGDITNEGLAQARSLSMSGLPHVEAVCAIAATAKHLKRLTDACIEKFQDDLRAANAD